MRVLGGGLTCWLLASAAAGAADPPDMSKLERKIVKEPVYTCKHPLYGLLAFGPRAEKHVWLVLDKSKADALGYDILYVDRAADGDLTPAKNRLEAKRDEGSNIFTLAEFRDPATGDTHKEFRVRVTGSDRPDVMVSLRWQGGMKMGGGYPADPGDYMKLSPDLNSVPVVWFGGDGPFRFQHWCSSHLTIGGTDDFKVFLGQKGSGPSSFCAFQEHVLPESDAVRATLVYHDRDGKERREVCHLKERC